MFPGPVSLEPACFSDVSLLADVACELVADILSHTGPVTLIEFAMGKHYQEDHSDIPPPNVPFLFTIRKRCRDYVDRQLWQSVLIKRENPAINTQLSENVGEGDWIKHTWKLM